MEARMDGRDAFTEDDLLDHVRGRGSEEMAQRITALEAEDDAFRAEMAVMRGLKGALADQDAGPGAFGWKRLEAAIAAETAAPARDTPNWWRIAAVFFFVASAGLAAVVANRAALDAPTYRTASEVSAGLVLGVIFAPTAAAADMADLLRSADAQIIEGPSAIGLFRIAFETEEARAAGLATFEASPLIALVAQE